MSAIAFYFQVVQALQEIRAPYMLVGAFAGLAFEAWCAQPTDIIIGKLKAWAEGRSAKHPADIHSMLVFSMSNLSDVAIHMPLVTAEASQLGQETLALWQELVARAQRDVNK